MVWRFLLKHFSLKTEIIRYLETEMQAVKKNMLQKFSKKYSLKLN